MARALEHMASAVELTPAFAVAFYVALKFIRHYRNWCFLFGLDCCISWGIDWGIGCCNSCDISCDFLHEIPNIEPHSYLVDGFHQCVSKFTPYPFSNIRTEPAWSTRPTAVLFLRMWFLAHITINCPVSLIFSPQRILQNCTIPMWSSSSIWPNGNPPPLWYLNRAPTILSFCICLWTHCSQ